jgi:tRNA uridine 5-carboxymethylaminomethyl modification enzyme
VGPERRRWWGARQERARLLDDILARPFSASELATHGAELRDDGVRRSLREWARFPSVSRETLRVVAPELIAIGDEALVAEWLQDAAYAPYVERQAAEVRALRVNEAILLPDDLDYRAIGGLSAEMIERLTRARPRTLGAAARLQGITPAALGALLVAVRGRAA